MKVFGSFGLISANGNLAVALKIVVQDIDMKTYQFKPSAPANSYFVFGSETSRSDLVASYPSDTPGAQFSVFQPLPAFARISDQLDNGTVTIAFNRKNGGTDVLVPFDVTVSNTDDNGKKSFSSKMVLEFYQCTGELIKSVRSTNH